MLLKSTFFTTAEMDADVNATASTSVHRGLSGRGEMFAAAVIDIQGRNMYGMSVVRCLTSAYYSHSLTCSICRSCQVLQASEQERHRVRFRCPDCGNDLNRSVNAV